MKDKCVGKFGWTFLSSADIIPFPKKNLDIRQKKNSDKRLRRNQIKGREEFRHKTEKNSHRRIRKIHAED